MEKNPPKHKQTTLDNFFNKSSNRPPLINNSMEIEPEIIILDDDLSTSNSFENLPMPHQNSKLWSMAKPVFSSFASKETKSFKQFFENFFKIVSLTTKEQNIQNLQAFFSIFSESQRNNFFDVILPFLGLLALQIETLFKKDQLVKRLVQGNKGSLVLSKQKVACLVVHMFFCTFFIDQPKPQKGKKLWGKINKNWNFSGLFKSSKIFHKNPSKIEKLNCIYHYFERLNNELLDLQITYIRVNSPMKSLDNWLFSSKSLKNVDLKDKNFIETYIQNTIQLDFANKYLGGGVLNTGCVQEEIRFCINPELLPSMMLFDCLNDNEAAILIGTEQYSTYKGYAGTFKYDKDFQDPADIDKMQKDIVILAIDAHKYQDISKQFTTDEILREINKAYIGFVGDGKYPEDKNKRAVATGKWGCGVFKGDPELKFMIQWLACSESDREMYFYRMEDQKLVNAELVIESFIGKPMGVVMQGLLRTCEEIRYRKDKRGVFEIMLSLS